MNPHCYLSPEEERPLESVPPCGGLAGIFRTIGCIGDSLSAGEFVFENDDGEVEYRDFYDYAWGAFLSRICGSCVHIFARGGMTAREFCESFARESGFYAPEKRCQAYIIALGVNDVYHENIKIGTADGSEPHTFSHYLRTILETIHGFDPAIRIFLMTMPHDHRSEAMPERADAHAALLREIAAGTPNTYLLDFRKYAPPFDAAFRKRYFQGGHMNAAGYLLTAQMVASYLDFLIRHHAEEFGDVGLIGMRSAQE